METRLNFFFLGVVAGTINTFLALHNSNPHETIVKGCELNLPSTQHCVISASCSSVPEKLP